MIKVGKIYSCFDHRSQISRFAKIQLHPYYCTNFVDQTNLCNITCTFLHGLCYLNQSRSTPAQSKVSAQNSPHQPDLYFLMRKDLYYHVGIATKIKSGDSHNINFSKTKMPRSGAPTIDDFEKIQLTLKVISLKTMTAN